MPHVTADNATKPITINVGGTRFTTLASTLTEGSTFLKSMLTGPWAAIEEPFIDANPKIFSHILDYMRTGTYPLFWDPSHNFNLELYAAVKAQADYFGVDSLATWISSESYTQAVSQVFINGPADSGAHKRRKGEKTTLEGNVEIMSHIAWKEVKVYECPRGVASHLKPAHCNDMCRDKIYNGKQVWVNDKKPLLHTTIQQARFHPEALVPKGTQSGQKTLRPKRIWAEVEINSDDDFSPFSP